MTTIPQSATALSSPCTFSQKWGDDPFTGLGHTQAPNALIEYAARIGLEPDECWLILCVLKFKHSAADPYPSQARLAELYGKSERTVRRVLKAVEGKGLLVIGHSRDESGQYGHTFYDFSPLRAALNECYWSDHPQERPQAASPVHRPKLAGGVTAGQKQAPPPANPDQNHRPKTATTTGQPCPHKRVLRRQRKDSGKEPEFFASLFEEKAQEGAGGGGPAARATATTRPAPAKPWLEAYSALPDGERDAWRTKARVAAGPLGIAPSNIPAISRLARELFAKGWEAGLAATPQAPI